MLTKLRSEAGNLMGAEAGDSWLSRQLPGGLNRAEDLGLNSQQRNSLQSAFDTERYRLAEVEQAKACASALAIRCLDELRAKAAQDPQLWSSERVEAWLAVSHTLSGGAKIRRRDFCVDIQTLNQCLDRLPSKSAKDRQKPRR